MSNGATALETFSANEDRQAELKKAFGDKYDKVNELDQERQKLEFEHHERRIKSLIPLWKKRQELVKTIPKFWATAILNHPGLATRTDAVDHKALEELEDIWIEHHDDVREWDLILSFSAQNPYFKDRKITKKFTIRPQPESVLAKDRNVQEPEKYSLDDELYTHPVKISWTSDQHDLTKKAPAADPTKLEEYDEFEGLGSIFNWVVSGEDGGPVAELFHELFEEATDAYANLVPEDGSQLLAGFEDDDDEDDDEDEDPTKEIDLDEEDRKSKRKRT